MDENDLQLLAREKYAGKKELITETDMRRLAAGEPLAYIIGWIPFLNVRVNLNSRPLIPRPETEWWTEKLIAQTKDSFGNNPFRVLDLCAGSGAIGVAIAKECPTADVTFAELVIDHCEQIRENILINDIDMARTHVVQSNLFNYFSHDTWHIIATNPPYIPSERKLDASVTSFEPAEALFAGEDGLAAIRGIASRAKQYIKSGGELWMECDTSNIHEARTRCLEGGARDACVLTDQYGRDRVVVAYY